MAEAKPSLGSPLNTNNKSLSSASPNAPVDRIRVEAQMRKWQDRVLDTTKSNPLISLNRSRVSKLQVIEPDGTTLFTRLVLEQGRLRMPLVRKTAVHTEQATQIDCDQDIDYVVEPGEVTFDAKPLEIMRRLRRIRDNARTTLEERGVTTLYLALGALRWRDELLGDSVSPLWMVPCMFEDKGPDAPLRLCAADEDSQMNPALEYYLRERHKIELPEIPEEADANALKATLHRIQLAVKELKWEVRKEVWLSTFSFESLVIYRDLRALTKVAAANPVVVALSRASVTVGKSEALPHDLDSLPTPSTVPIPVLPADSSQLEALTQTALGRNVVIHGPPGTGKSQTIANLIADALARNKKVLFVSAKMAALNVVYERLKKLGLQRFCLEAHSTKAGKQQVIDELRRTLETLPAPDSGALDQELQALLRVREELNAYARDVHMPVEPLGLSVFQANARLEYLRTVADVPGPLPWPDPLTVTREEFDNCIHALEELGTNAIAFDQGTAHPWCGFAATTFSLADQESLESCLRTVVEFERQVTSAADSLQCLISNARELSIRDWSQIDFMLSAITETPHLPKGWWEKSDSELSTLASLFSEAAVQQDELDFLTNEITQVIKGTPKEVAALLAPAKDQYRAWNRVFKPAYWRWRKAVQASLRSDFKFTRKLLTALEGQCQRALKIEEWLAAAKPHIAEYADALLLKNSAYLRTISQCLVAASKCKKALALIGRSTAPVLALDSEMKCAARSILNQIKNPAVVAAVGRLDFDWPQGFIGDVPASQAPLPEVSRRATILLSSMQKARERVLLNQALEKCAVQGLSPFVAALGSASAADASRIFERRFIKLWLSSAINRSKNLSGFTEAKGSSLLVKFRHLDARVQELAVRRAQTQAAAASSRIREAADFPEISSEVGILRRELQKQKRFKPLRKLFAEIPHVLQALKPCLLMSPISVSTYLNPELFHFDLVVFDEASQLPTAEAIPSTLRASQVVVAGDSKQLPPTSFFEASLTPEEEAEEDDDALGLAPLESFLDDCVAVVPVFQEVHLCWHYRSRDERLIQFSNHFFYDNRLITFPSAHPLAPGQGVRFVHVKEGIYDRGRSRTNRREAREVARLAVEHFERYPKRTLGVVALSYAQKEAIEDAVAELQRDRPDLETFFDVNRDDAFFVKSLENVQGDERDTIIISVGYGRDLSGGLSMNFGPLNRDGGWRRLNVLITRAKYECILVASVRADDLCNVNPNNRGATALRDFLYFAERNGELPAERTVLTGAETNEFEEAVRAALMDRGFHVDMQVGVSKFRIDLAVRDPRDKGRYLLGIECDGATYHSARSARDRDLLRQLVLQRMGWRIHRVWSTEWFHHREQAVASILKSIEQAQRTPVDTSVVAPPLGPISTVEDRTAYEGSRQAPVAERRYKAGCRYLRYEARGGLKREQLLSPRHTSSLALTIGEIVKTEGPVHREVIISRLKEVHGVKKIGANIKANIERAFKAAETSHLITRDDVSDFYACRECQSKCFRRPIEGMRRPIEHIHSSEIALAVLYLVEDQFGVMEEYLPHAVARLFEIEHLRPDSADRIRAVIEDLVGKGLLRRAGSQLHLA